MMRAAVEAVHEEAHKEGLLPPLILGVTVLTSLQARDLKTVGIALSVEAEVVQLAVLAQQAGLDGVVASPLEIKPLRKACGEDLVIVTPGVRPDKGRSHDQARVMTPAEAIQAGADYVVIGRPIKEAPDPLKATQKILQEIRSVR